ncbi:hypothetical protein C9043_01810 [Escherichia coli]|nr:hypothetical protein EFV01_03900 [Escherichia coli]TFX82453.1 hypothetical protein DEN99_06680 [Escherichia coli]TFX94672.1 hypothetical protein DEN98_00740 [Escherichia coli]TFX99074.1 hypothetical protein DEN97_00740 [Escherichia coli]TJJ09166.1 hypothetical protein C9123_00625 [Escherichia coli]
MTLATSSGKHKITSIFNEWLNRLFVTVCHWLSLSVTISGLLKLRLPKNINELTIKLASN